MHERCKFLVLSKALMKSIFVYEFNESVELIHPIHILYINVYGWIKLAFINVSRGGYRAYPRGC